MTQYAPPPADAPPLGGPDDDAVARYEAAADHHRRLMVAAARRRIDLEARDLVNAERAAAEQIPPFDAGLLSEVLARPDEPPHRAEGIIPAESGTLVVAQRKTGKTTLQLNLARSLILGDDFLGRFPVTKVDGNVGFLNYEVSAQMLARWANEAGVAHNRLFLVNLRGRRNPLGNDRDRESLAKQLRAREIESLIVDPFGRAFTGNNQNDSGEVGAWLADLDRFARGDVGARDVILAAHSGWNGERTRGATALEDWADSIVTVTRDRDDERQRFLRAEGRDVLVDEDQLEFDPATRTLTLAGTGSRRLAAKTRQVEAQLPVVLELLRDTPTMSGNQLDVAIKQTDLPHSKGDGAKAAQILERRGMVGSKAGPRNSRLFFLLTSPTSLNLPQGNSGDFPHLPLRGEVATGTETATSSTGELTLDDQETP